MRYSCGDQGPPRFVRGRRYNCRQSNWQNNEFRKRNYNFRGNKSQSQFIANRSDICVRINDGGAVPNNFLNEKLALPNSHEVEWTMDTTGCEGEGGIPFREHETEDQNFLPLNICGKFKAPQPLSSSPFYNCRFLSLLLEPRVDNAEIKKMYTCDDVAKLIVDKGKTCEQSRALLTSPTPSDHSRTANSNILPLSPYSDTSKILLYKEFLLTFASFVEEAKRSEDDRSLLRNALREIIVDNPLEGLVSQRLTQMENRLQNLETQINQLNEKLLPCMETSATSTITSTFPTKSCKCQPAKNGKMKSSRKKKRTISDKETYELGEKPEFERNYAVTSQSPVGHIERNDSKDVKPKQVLSEQPLSFIVDDDECVCIYVAGTCSSNDGENGRAGIGVWFGHGHPLNVSLPIHGTPTNNNAAIQAARVAIDIAKEAGLPKIRIYSDSSFLLKCVRWIDRWKQNGWRRLSGQPVKNKDELKKLKRVFTGIPVAWEKVVAHTHLKRNEMADRLASQGAAMGMHFKSEPNAE